MAVSHTDSLPRHAAYQGAMPKRAKGLVREVLDMRSQAKEGYQTAGRTRPMEAALSQGALQLAARLQRAQRLPTLTLGRMVLLIVATC